MALIKKDKYGLYIVEVARGTTLGTNSRSAEGDAEDTATNATNTNNTFGTNYDSKGKAHATDSQREAAERDYEFQSITNNVISNAIQGVSIASEILGETGSDIATTAGAIGPLGPSGTMNPSQAELIDAANSINFDLETYDNFDNLGSQFLSDELISSYLSPVGEMTYNAETGVTTVEFESSFLGTNFSYDKHYINGQELGFVDEITADFFEAIGIEVSELNIDIATGLTELAYAMFTGVPIATQILSAVSVASNIAQATGTITENQNRTLQATTALLGLGIKTINFVKQTAAIAKMSGYLTTNAKLMAGILTITTAGQIISQFNDIMEEYGIDPTEISDIDLAKWDTDGDNNGDSIGNGSAENMIADFAKWYVLSKVQLGKVGQQIDADDVFNKMAGGILYDAMFGGGAYFHPNNIEYSNSLASVFDAENINQYSLMSLQGGDDYFFNKSQVVDTSSDLGSDMSSAITTAKKSKINQISKLQEEANGLIDQYTTKVNSYNNSSASYKTKANYDKITAQLNSLNVKIEKINTEIRTIASKI